MEAIKEASRKPGEERRGQVRQEGVGGAALAQGQFRGEKQTGGVMSTSPDTGLESGDLRHSPWKALSLGTDSVPSRGWSRVVSFGEADLRKAKAYDKFLP